MREIKFRAWDKYRQEFVNPAAYASLFNYNGDKNIAVATPDGINITLQQYTGLKDKNGVEIYEGDMLNTREGIYCIKETLPFIALEDRDGMSYDNGDFYVGYDIQQHQWGNFEVIGNMYENPELLETN